MAKTVMIVDDSPSMRQLVEFTLRDAGYSVVSATGGHDALEKFGQTKVDAVVTDLNMPGMDGIELARRLRQGVGFQYKPILMLTTESCNDKKCEGRAAGISGWIVKPFAPEMLIKTLNRLSV